MPQTQKDRVLTSILQCRFKAITQEMGYTLLRTTRSPILNEARDFVTGIYDAKGRMLEQLRCSRFAGKSWNISVTTFTRGM